MSYQNTLCKLFNTHRFKLEVNDLKKVVKILNNPHTAYKCIHVAGTNGKGSVCTKVAAALQMCGYSVGMYTSPHICTFRERIRVNDMYISEDDVVRLSEYVMRMSDIDLTFFEICTLMALCYFKEKKVEYAVLETGIGGRLDATNVIDTPAVCCITSIGYDHMSILGDTLEKIASEKFGIIKRNAPVVVGCEIESMLKTYMSDRHMNNHVYIPKVDKHIHNDFQQVNKSIARTVLDVLNIRGECVEKGILTQPPLRYHVLPFSTMQLVVEHIYKECIYKDKNRFKDIYIDKTYSDIFKRYDYIFKCPAGIVLDVGHNSTAIQHLLCDLMSDEQFENKKFRFMIALTQERHMDTVQPFADDKFKNRILGLHFLEGSHPRLLTYDALMAREGDASEESIRRMLIEGHEDLQKIKSDMCVCEDMKNSTHTSLMCVLTQCICEQSVLVVCGTFYIMADVIHIFNLPFPTRDHIDMNEPSLKPCK